MTANLARNDHVQLKPLTTPLLEKDSKLSLSDWYRAYIIFGYLIAGVLITFAAVAMFVLNIDVFAIFLCSGAVLCFIISFCYLIVTEDKNIPDQRQRLNRVIGEKLLYRRPHADRDLTRLPELLHKFPRYSVKITREGNKAKFTVVKHIYQGRPYLVPWELEETNLGFGGQRWGHAPIEQRTIDNPTVDSMQARYDAMQETAKELEEQAYAEVLEQHKIEIMAQAVHHPDPRANEELKEIL